MDGERARAEGLVDRRERELRHELQAMEQAEEEWPQYLAAVSYTHLRAQETRGNIGCRDLV